MGGFELVYSLTNYQNELFVPTAFVVELDEQGRLTYSQSKVVWGNLEAYGFEKTEVRRQLFEHLEALQIASLEAKFNRTGRKPIALWKLFEDGDVKKAVLRHFHHHLHSFLSMVLKERLHLGLDIERKDWVEKKLLYLNVRPVLPNLHFQKKDDGVYYQLYFNNKRLWVLRKRQVFILCNQPAWVIVDNALYRLEHITGLMLTPFLSKKEVFIPQNAVKEYFQKFILKVASKVDVEAEGFEIITYQTLQSCELFLQFDYLQGLYSLGLVFQYERAAFQLHEARQQRIQLDFVNENDIVIYRNLRSEPQENAKLEALVRLGLVRHATAGLVVDASPTAGESPYPLVHWLTTRQKTLAGLGFSVRPLELEAKPIALLSAEVSLNLQQENDWFDIHGTVNIGAFQVPFHRLAGYIRTGMRYFPLPDGTHFVIPDEWMTRYKPAFEMGRVHSESLRLTKSQYPMLEAFDFQNTSESASEVLAKNYASVRYEPSEHLRATLRPYQQQGVQWLVQLYHNGLGACLADDMGLGKTLQTIAVLLYAKEQKQKNALESESLVQGLQTDLFAPEVPQTGFVPLCALIIMPASLIFNWENEIRKFAPYLILHKHISNRRTDDVRLLKQYDVVLTTYQTARRDVEMLQSIEFQYVVLDESQQIKNKDSQIFKAINRLKAAHKISLSGTPIENSLADLWAQMQFINPDLLGGFTFFKKEFILPIEKYNDEPKKDRLKTLIAPYLLRRTKESVAKDLPTLTEKVFYSEMTKEQARIYEREKSAARNFILQHYHPQNLNFHTVVVNTLLKLRQIAIHPRLANVEDNACESGKFNDILQHLDVIQRGGHKTLIFSQFVSHLHFFKEAFERDGVGYEWLTGKTSLDDRAKAVAHFEEDPQVAAFLISLKAGGTGLNLTAADYVFITDPWWNPSAEQQAIARAHRIGQTKNVIAIKFITKNTVEEKILRLQERKQLLADEIINKNEKVIFSKQDIDFILE